MRSLHDIAQEIKKDWTNVYFAAKPYLAAMSKLQNMNDQYYQESAESIVRYFLVNAGTWRGPVARRIKAELRDMLK